MLLQPVAQIALRHTEIDAKCVQSIQHRAGGRARRRNMRVARGCHRERQMVPALIRCGIPPLRANRAVGTNPEDVQMRCAVRPP